MQTKQYLRTVLEEDSSEGIQIKSSVDSDDAHDVSMILFVVFPTYVARKILRCKTTSPAEREED
jgi:hypothetical protein